MKKMTELTPKQKKVLRFIYDQIRQSNLPPTIREIASRFDFSSTGTVRDYLRALVQKGYIRISSKKSRAIELVREAFFHIPIMGTVRAGMPTLAVEDIEGYLDFDKIKFSDDEVFALRVKGDSMSGAGIVEGDLALVRRQRVAQVGETVVALMGEEATVKRLARKGQHYYLEPANPHYEAIPVNEDVAIIGKVISVIRRYS